MAHTDRDDDRIYWRRHHRYECPNSWPRHVRGVWTTKRCDICKTEPPRKCYTSTDGKSEWNRDHRQAERSHARRTLRECRDYDDLTIKVGRRGVSWGAPLDHPTRRSVSSGRYRLERVLHGCISAGRSPFCLVVKGFESP